LNMKVKRQIILTNADVVCDECRFRGKAKLKECKTCSRFWTDHHTK
jgi:hypothetical protein